MPTQNISSRDEGFVINRSYYLPTDLKLEKAVKEAKVGDILVGKIDIVVPEMRHFVAIENYIPAGFELINFNLDTESASFVESLQGKKGENDLSAFNSDLYPDVEEMRDDRVFVFKQSLEPGVYTYIYYVRALIPGSFNEMPAQISEMYFPENFGRTGGDVFKVVEK